jgi:hypothetical protein
VISTWFGVEMGSVVALALDLEDISDPGPDSGNVAGAFLISASACDLAGSKDKPPVKGLGLAGVMRRRNHTYVARSIKEVESTEEHLGVEDVVVEALYDGGLVVAYHYLPYCQCGKHKEHTLFPPDYHHVHLTTLPYPKLLDLSKGLFFICRARSILDIRVCISNVSGLSIKKKMACFTR